MDDDEEVFSSDAAPEPERSFRVVPVPMLRDNYGYLVALDLEGDRSALFIDPADAVTARQAVAREGVHLKAILNTHHHRDHTGGNLGLLAQHSGLSVFGPEKETAEIPGLTYGLRAGDSIGVPGLEGRVLDVGCHTRGHLAFLFGSSLFTGDTLFLGGCGRFFEGTAEDMYRALYEVIGALDGDTHIFCGHEYTQKNLEFALTIEPDNDALRQRYEGVVRQRIQGLPTVPGLLSEERDTNPFLRVHVRSVAEAVSQRVEGVSPDDPVQVLFGLRQLKDVF